MALTSTRAPPQMVVIESEIAELQEEGFEQDHVALHYKKYIIGLALIILIGLAIITKIMYPKGKITPIVRYSKSRGNVSTEVTEGDGLMIAAESVVQLPKLSDDHF